MNMNPKTLIKLFNERKNVFNGHADMYRFVLETFGQGLEQGAEIEVFIRRPDGETAAATMTLQESDMNFFTGVKELLN
ncbi:MAG: hypothetical protein K2O34_13510 [Acetatifactor sp.]|nr:hypothetical protein [Acetatifactor sp.]